MRCCVAVMIVPVVQQITRAGAPRSVNGYGNYVVGKRLNLADAAAGFFRRDARVQRHQLQNVAAVEGKILNALLVYHLYERG